MSKLAEPGGEPEDCYKALAWVIEASKEIKQGIAAEIVRIRISEIGGYVRAFRTESLHSSSSGIPSGEGDKSNPSLEAASDKISSQASHWLGRRETAGRLGRKPSSK